MIKNSRLICKVCLYIWGLGIDVSVVPWNCKLVKLRKHVRPCHMISEKIVFQINLPIRHKLLNSVTYATASHTRQRHIRDSVTYATFHYFRLFYKESESILSKNVCLVYHGVRTHQYKYFELSFVEIAL